jgi:hypothetical protein
MAILTIMSPEDFDGAGADLLHLPTDPPARKPGRAAGQEDGSLCQEDGGWFTLEGNGGDDGEAGAARIPSKVAAP